MGLIVRLGIFGGGEGEAIEDARRVRCVGQALLALAASAIAPVVRVDTVSARRTSRRGVGGAAPLPVWVLARRVTLFGRTVHGLLVARAR